MRNRIARTRSVFFLTLLALAPVSLSAQQAVPSPWTAADIGGPAAAGSTSYNQGTFSIAASGSDIWGPSDQFHFVYQQISGDVEIVALVNSLSPVDVWSKAGVMIRGSLSPSAPHAFALVSGASGSAYQRRPTTGGETEHSGGPAVMAPYWVRLARAGTSVTASVSADGRSWTAIDTATIALGISAYVGIAVTSHSDGALTTADVTQVAVSAQSMPGSLKTQDIGNPTITGKTVFANGTYTITAAGADIWGDSDQFHYVFTPVSGDVEVVGRVASLGVAHEWSKAGVMIRESLSPDSRQAHALVSAQRGTAFQRRVDTAGETSHSDGGTAGAPQWVRLVRTDSQFQAFRSADGQTWTLMGTDTIPMNSSAYVGIAVTSHNPDATTTAVVDHLTIGAAQSDPNQPPLVNLTQPITGAQYQAPASIALSATASDPEGHLSRVEFFSGTDRIGSYTSPPYAMTWSSVTAGTYSVFAMAFDADGGSATSNVSTINVGGSVPLPRFVIFTASADHDTLVTGYRLDIFAAGANPNTATRLSSSDLGKPARNGAGDITVDQTSYFNTLKPGVYVATVSAIGDGGEGRGNPVTFTR